MAVNYPPDLALRLDVENEGVRGRISFLGIEVR